MCANIKHSIPAVRQKAVGFLPWRTTAIGFEVQKPEFPCNSAYIMSELCLEPFFHGRFVTLPTFICSVALVSLYTMFIFEHFWRVSRENIHHFQDMGFETIFEMFIIQRARPRCSCKGWRSFVLFFLSSNNLASHLPLVGQSAFLSSLVFL